MTGVRPYAGSTARRNVRSSAKMKRPASAVTKLAAVGVESSVITADHGHHFTTDKDDSMKIAGSGPRSSSL